MNCPYCGSHLEFYGFTEVFCSNPECENGDFSILLNEKSCPDCGREFTDADTYCIQCGHIRNKFTKKAVY